MTSKRPLSPLAEKALWILIATVIIVFFGMEK